MNESNPSYLFTLIHGTFAANSTWVNDHEHDNPDGFRARLKAALNKPTSFSATPPWGSTLITRRWRDLTNASRLNGADNLRRHILSLPRQNKQKHFLVAHSHGGNVAMYAMQDKAVQERVDGLICISTPFLYPRRRPLSILALTLSLAIMTVGVWQFISETALLNNHWLAWLSAISLLIVAILIPAFLIWVVSKERYQQKLKNSQTLNEHVQRLSYKDPKKPILLIRSAGDEASGLLRGAQFLSWLGGIVMKVGGRQLYVLSCLTTISISMIAYLGVGSMPQHTMSILNFLMITSSAIMTILLMSLTISRLSVGFDAWQWVGELETMIEDGPPGIKAELIVITPRHFKGGGLSHTAVYNEIEAIHAIATWCNDIAKDH